MDTPRWRDPVRPEVEIMLTLAVSLSSTLGARPASVAAQGREGGWGPSFILKLENL